jgi:hypothetical protein
MLNLNSSVKLAMEFISTNTEITKGIGEEGVGEKYNTLIVCNQIVY